MAALGRGLAGAASAVLGGGHRRAAAGEGSWGCGAARGGSRERGRRGGSGGEGGKVRGARGG